MDVLEVYAPLEWLTGTDSQLAGIVTMRNRQYCKSSFSSNKTHKDQETKNDAFECDWELRLTDCI